MSVYNKAVEYLKKKYVDNAPLANYTPTDLNIKRLVREYIETGGAKPVKEELKTAMDYVYLWKALCTFNSIKHTLQYALKDYSIALNKLENRIIERGNDCVKINYRDVIFTIVNYKGESVLKGEFECFDCLGNSFGIINHNDIPDTPEGEKFVI